MYITFQVDFEVKIVAGSPTRRVVLQETKTASATWIVLDRYVYLRMDATYVSAPL